MRRAIFSYTLYFIYLACKVYLLNSPGRYREMSDIVGRGRAEVALARAGRRCGRADNTKAPAWQRVGRVRAQPVQAVPGDA